MSLSLTQQPQPKSPRPFGASLWLMLAVVIVMTIARLLIASMTELSPDEAYYWLWSKHLAMGYYDHPPMVAWCIKLSTLIWGDQAFGVRALFVFMGLLYSYFIYDTAKTLWGKTELAHQAVIWASISILIGLGTTLATPDVPSVLFYAMGAWALSKIAMPPLGQDQTVKGLHGLWWLIFGLAAGLGVLSKYTNFFLGLSVLYWMMITPKAREWLRTPWFWLGGIVALGVMGPNLWWNANNDYVGLIKQFSRLEVQGFDPIMLVNFILAQILLINPIIALFAMIGLWQWYQTEVCKPFDKVALVPMKLLAALCVPILAYLIWHALKERVQGNWPAPIYPVLALIAAKTAYDMTKAGQKPILNRLASLALPVGAALVILASVLAAAPQSLLKTYDATDLMRGWHKSGRAFDAMAKAHSVRFIAVRQYSLMGQFSRVFEGRYKVIAMADRVRYPYQTIGDEAALVGQKALIIQTGAAKNDLGRCFDELRDLGVYKRVAQTNRKNSLHLYSGRLKSAQCRLDDVS